MRTWNDYKNHVRETSPELGKDMDEVEAVSRIAGNQAADALNRSHGAELSSNLYSGFKMGFRRKV